MTFTSPDDPYRDSKKYHLAGLIDKAGRVSALCFKRPRPVDLSIARYTFAGKNVTCDKCLAIMEKEGISDAYKVAGKGAESSPGHPVD